MKKTLLVIVALLLLIAAGYVVFQKSGNTLPVIPPGEVELTRLTGIVNTPVEMDLLTVKTNFVLQTQSGEQIFIDSANVNLRKYKKRNVEVGGQWNADKTIFMITEVMSLSKETEAKDMYQNTSLGVKFNYPSLWTLKENTNVLTGTKVVITPYETDDSELSSVDTIVIERSENNRKLSPAEWLSLDDQYRPKDATDTDTYQQSKIGLAQLDAVKKTTATGAKVTFFVARDTYMYSFSHTTVFDSDKDTYRNAFYELVMGFEFIPFGEQAGTSTPATIVVPRTPSTPPKPAELPTPPPPAPTPSAAPNKTSFINYIKDNIATLAPEASSSGSWAVTSTEFAFPEGQPDQFTAIYATYGNGADSRKILLNVTDLSDPSKMTVGAYFKPGELTDWVLATGTDTAKGSDKSVVAGGDTASEIVVKKGMTLLTARTFNIKIQYPSSWYWAYAGQSYNFGDKPVTADNVLVKLVEAPYWTADNAKPANFVDVCDSTTQKYCLVGAKEYQDTMNQMIGTLQQ